MDDEAETRDVFWDIQEGDEVFDVGAAYGSYTLPALACGAQRVFAWSPQGPPGEAVLEADFLRAGLEKNGWADRAHIFLDGLYDKTGWLDAQTQELFASEPARKADGRFVNNDIVAVRTLRDWYNQEYRGRYTPLARAWLKLDVEGAEVAILKSSTWFLAQHTPRVLVENHNFKNAAIEGEIRGLMTSLGYREAGTRPHGTIVTHSLYVPE